MKRTAKPVDWWGLAARLALLGLVGWLLNLSPRPHDLDQAMYAVNQALQNQAPGRAAANLELAAQYFPWRSDLWIAAGHYHLQAGQPQSAIDAFTRQDIRPRLGSADLAALGEAYWAAGKPEQAEQAWKEALAAGERSLQLYDRLYQIFQERGDYTAAVEMLQPTLALRPDETWRAYQLGLYLAALQPEDALTYLDQAAQDEALADQARELLRTIRTAQQSDEPSYVFVEAGRQLAEMGEWALAGEAFRQAVQARPDYAEAWALLGESRQQVGGDLSQAQIELEQAQTLKPDSAMVNSLLALYWERRGNVEKMVVFTQASAEAEPENPLWQAEWGRALALAGDLAAARQHYEQATELAEENELYWRLLAVFSLQYQVDVAGLGLPAARQALALQPGSAAALDLMGEAYMILGNELLAERFLARALQADVQYAPAWMHLGALHLYRGEVEWGRTMLLKAEELAGPDDPLLDQIQRLRDLYSP